MNYEGADVEGVLLKNDSAAHNLKVKAFTNRMDRLSEEAKKAKTPEDAKRVRTLRNQTLYFLNKNGGTNYKS